MMSFLTFDVSNGSVQLRHARAERAVLFLPPEQSMFRKSLVHPLRRPAFEELQGLGNGESRRQRKQNVYMIFHAANFDGLHFVLTSDPAEKRPEPLTQIWSNERTSFLRAEDAMKIGTDV